MLLDNVSGQLINGFGVLICRTADNSYYFYICSNILYYQH